MNPLFTTYKQTTIMKKSLVKFQNLRKQEHLGQDAFFLLVKAQCSEGLAQK